jgi:mannopine transport system permease protein
MGKLGTRAPGLVLSALCVAILLFLVVPILIIVPMSLTARDYIEFPPSALSLRWYVAYFTDPDWIHPTLFSLKIAILSTLAATICGTSAALALVRGGLLGNNLVNAVIASPLVVPAVITAVAFYMLLSRLHMLGSTLGFVLADTVLTLPFVIFPVAANLQRIEPRLEWTALSLGASRLAAVRLVTLPLARSGMMIGAAFAFITAFDEATVSAFISSFEGKTLPKKMFEGIDWELSPVIAAVASMLTVISILVAVLLAILRRSERPSRFDPRPQTSDGEWNDTATHS